LFGVMIVFAMKQANAATPTIEERESRLEVSISNLEEKLANRTGWLVVSVLIGLGGLALNYGNFRAARENRKADLKVKSFETNYEGALQSALERNEVNGSDIMQAAQAADPHKRVEDVDRLWNEKYLPSYSALTNQLRKLDESGNVEGDEWSSLVDDALDRLGVAVDVLLDPDKGASAVHRASDSFAHASRSLAEAVRSHLIKHKNKLG